MAAKGVRATLRRRLPGIAWRDDRLAQRDEQVAELRRNLREVHAELATAQSTVLTPRSSATPSGSTTPPSFRRHIHDLRRGVEELRLIDPAATHPLLQVARKLRNHRLAASHGVRVPEILAVWSRPDQIDLSSLPDEFVLKSDGGAGGHGVLPLSRVGRDGYRMVGGDPDGALVLTMAQVVERYGAGRRVEGPFFAEGMLARPGVEGLPDDIKIYSFYGEVGQVLLRRMSGHADLTQARYRFLAGDGTDLGTNASLTHRIDASIPPPSNIDAYLEIARHLSRAMGLPFVRVDLYETANGPVFGELTRGPGGAQRYRPNHDELMGLLWQRAQYRLEVDLVAGRPLANLHGDRPSRNLYPDDSTSAAASWPVVRLPCGQWC